MPRRKGYKLTVGDIFSMGQAPVEKPKKKIFKFKVKPKPKKKTKDPLTVKQRITLPIKVPLVVKPIDKLKARAETIRRKKIGLRLHNMDDLVNVLDRLSGMSSGVSPHPQVKKRKRSKRKSKQEL